VRVAVFKPQEMPSNRISTPSDKVLSC